MVRSLTGGWQPAFAACGAHCSVPCCRWRGQRTAATEAWAADKHEQHEEGERAPTPLLQPTPDPALLRILTCCLPACLQGLSSNSRYQVVFGLERLVDEVRAVVLPRDGHLRLWACRCHSNFARERGPLSTRSFTPRSPAINADPAHRAIARPTPAVAYFTAPYKAGSHPTSLPAPFVPPARPSRGASPRPPTSPPWSSALPTTWWAVRTSSTWRAGRACSSRPQDPAMQAAGQAVQRTARQPASCTGQVGSRRQTPAWRQAVQLRCSRATQPAVRQAVRLAAAC